MADPIADKPDNLVYGCLIRVRDLAKVKTFYQDVLELGPPLVDSNFWVEFRLPGNGVLVLEQCSAVRPGESKQDVSCLIGVSGFEQRLKALTTHQVRLHRPPRPLPGRQTATVTDPEGNLVTLYSREP
jgi:predicted enzyme related to lactoylglutathione lyase